MAEKTMIVVAGGSGLRMGADLPKQFLELNGKPILMHTLENLNKLDGAMQLVLVLPSSQFGYWEELKSKHRFSVEHSLAPGGTTRFLSVKSGLALAQGELIGVHDGVRPFLSQSCFDDCFEMAELNGAAVPVVPIVQSLRKVRPDKNEAVNRDEYRAVQTPQCFRRKVILEAYEKASSSDYSDDATVVEASGNAITLVDGDNHNIKITNPFDLQLAQLLIE